MVQGIYAYLFIVTLSLAAAYSIVDWCIMAYYVH